jgi:hypothetical protein
MAIEDKVQRNKTRFESANAEIVRSIIQRGLLHKWLRLYDREKTAPSFDDFAAEADIDNSPDIGSFTLKPQREGVPLILVDKAGRRILDYYGTTDAEPADEHDLAACLDQDLRSVIMSAYYESFARGLPVYSILKVRDSRGRNVDFERLLLPLIENGEIRRIVTCIEAISTEGRFDTMNLLRASDKIPTTEVAAVIDRDLFHNRPGPIPNDDPIEFD